MSDYSLTVWIERKQFQWLRANNYKLCIARKSDKGYTTIWQSVEFNERHVFRWDADFQVFWVKNFKVGVQASAECNPMPIEFGQTITIRADTSLSDPEGIPDESGSFKVTNKCNMPVHVGLNSKVGGEWRPSFVSPFQVLAGAQDTLTPLSSVKVWFQENSESGSMITEVIGTAQEADYKGRTTHSIKYSGVVAGAGNWTLDKTT